MPKNKNCIIMYIILKKILFELLQKEIKLFLPKIVILYIFPFFVSFSICLCNISIKTFSKNVFPNTLTAFRDLGLWEHQGLYQVKVLTTEDILGGFFENN